MKTRNESLVFHQQTFNIGAAMRWLREYNRASRDPRSATLFHVFLWAHGRVLHERPLLNRFVSGGRLYQRDTVYVSFAAKKSLEPEGPLVTVKLHCPKDQTFRECVSAICDLVERVRGRDDRLINKELKFLLRLPGVLLSVVFGLARVLDRFNLLPRALIDPDPMYSSLFVANLGSVGLDDAYHHLYEYGTVGIFACMGTARKVQVLTRDGTPEVIDGVQVGYTLDERVNDGFYTATALNIVRLILESPEKYLGPA